jgi:hypothetical protein
MSVSHTARLQLCPMPYVRTVCAVRQHNSVTRLPHRYQVHRTLQPGIAAACGGASEYLWRRTAPTRSPRGTACARRGACASSAKQRRAATASEGEAAVLGASSRAAVHQHRRHDALGATNRRSARYAQLTRRGTRAGRGHSARYAPSNRECRPAAVVQGRAQRPPTVE